MSSAIAIVPATSANLGPGFDCMGIALQLYNHVKLSRLPIGEAISPSQNQMVLEAASAFFHAANQPPFPFEWLIEGEVPSSRGLGSSVTVRLGILHALNHLAGSPLDRHQIFQICSRLEGHPDNAAPASFGGYTLSPKGMPLQHYFVDSSLHIILLIPDFEILTENARRILPPQIPFPDAVHSAAQAAAIAAAFASGNYKFLEGGFVDHLHQPYRKSLIPFFDEVLRAARLSGALGGWLSGSGSTIACATLTNPEPIAAAMLNASKQQNARVLITKVDNSGVRVHSQSP